jgi:23S rRNA (guanosine2251-2'-O)-methyltransferase
MSLDSMRLLYIILHDLRSVHNTAAIFRTADAIGVSKIFLSGTTPTPIDRFARPRTDFAKAALGAEISIPWEYVKSPITLIGKLRAEGFEIIAVEQSEKSVDYKKVRPKRKTAVIFGNEVKGVTASILKRSDIVSDIAMRGKKESLNVSVAAGVVLFRWFDC